MLFEVRMVVDIQNFSELDGPLKGKIKSAIEFIDWSKEATSTSTFTPLEPGDWDAPRSMPEPKTKAEIKASIGKDFLTSFEDGKRYKMLKRHLTTLGMTPEEYRTKWGLPADYPMVARSYSAVRTALAKKTGLGRK